MSEDRIKEEAALWMARARDPRFDGWDALTDWLEADPAHNVAYEAAFAAHDLAGEVSSPLRSEVPTDHQRRRSRGTVWFLGGATGVALAASALFAVFMPHDSPSTITAETRPGEQRMVTLADGSRIALNGGSRLVLSTHNGRTARLDRGEAMFSVVHDDARPFTVDVAGQRLVDLGTRFNVLRTAHGSEVMVAEGAVLYDPQGAAVRLSRGRMLRKNDRSDVVEVSDIDPGSIGSWRSGRLVYRGASLERVAGDISRLTGEHVTVAPDLASHDFTGVIVVPNADRRRFISRLGMVLDVDVAKQSRGYYLKARAGR